MTYTEHSLLPQLFREIPPHDARRMRSAQEGGGHTFIYHRNITEHRFKAGHAKASGSGTRYPVHPGTHRMSKVELSKGTNLKLLRVGFKNLGIYCTCVQQCQRLVDVLWWPNTVAWFCLSPMGESPSGK